MTVDNYIFRGYSLYKSYENTLSVDLKELDKAIEQESKRLEKINKYFVEQE